MRGFLRFLKYFGRLLGLGVVLGVPAGLAYLYFVGFSEGWRAEVAKAMGGASYRMEIGRLTFNPFRGIVVEGAEIFRRDDPSRQLARVDHLVVTPNLALLLRGKVSIDRLALSNASVVILFAEDRVEPDAIELRGIGADILNGNGQLTISRAECWFGDIHIVIRGNLLNPEIAGKPQTPSGAEDVAKRIATVRSILRTLQQVHFAGAKPELSIALRGDLMEPADIIADEISLRTSGVRFDELKFDRVILAATLADRKIHVTNFAAQGPDGNLQVAGEWDFASSSGHFEVNGGLNWAPLLVLAGRDDLARQIVFERPPYLEASISADRGANGLEVSAIGRVSTAGFQLKGVKVRSFTASAAWRDGLLYVQDAVLRSATGTVKADVMSGPGLFKLSLESEAIPNEFLPFFGPNERKIIELLEFDDVPKLKIGLSGTRANLDALSGAGTIELGRSAMRGSWVDFARASVVVEDRAIVYNDLVIGKGRQRATGSFTYDFGRKEVRLNGVRSNMNPPEVLMWVDPRVAETVATYRFRSPPDVSADGVAHMKDPSRNDLRIKVSAPGGMAYTLLNKDLVFGNVAGSVRLKGQRVLADVGQATLYGGAVTVKADVSIAPNDPTFRVGVTMDGVDFPSLTNLYFGYAKSQGVVSGGYEFTASLKDPAGMRGQGSVRVEEGHVMAIPVFGPLSIAISTIIPGAGHESARLATMDFTIADQLVRTKSLDIQGAGFELFGDGTVGFPSGKLDLTVRINAKGIPGIVLFPVSKLMEYVSTGTMSDPRWRPKIIPREFFDVLGGGASEPDASTAPAKKPQRPAAPLR